MRAIALTFAGIFGAVATFAFLASMGSDASAAYPERKFAAGKMPTEGELADAMRSREAARQWIAHFWAATITSAVFFAGACAAGSPSRRTTAYRTNPGTLADPRSQLPPTPRREDPAEFLDSLR